MHGKRGVVFGVANQRSIAWHIAQELYQAGGEIVFTYLNERLRSSVEKLASPYGSTIIECNAVDDEQVQEVYSHVAAKWGTIDFIVHSVAYANREDLEGRFSKVSKSGFRIALESSAYSLIPVVKYAAPLMQNGGAVVTMTFDASLKVYPGYNVMATAKAALENEVKYLAAEYGDQNIRVNAISAGPLPTIAARSIPGFSEMQRFHKERSPLKRNITQKEVAQGALFLLSDMSSGITGAVLPIDAGYGIMATI